MQPGLCVTGSTSSSAPSFDVLSALAALVPGADLHTAAAFEKRVEQAALDRWNSLADYVRKQYVARGESHTCFLDEAREKIVKAEAPAKALLKRVADELPTNVTAARNLWRKFALEGCKEFGWNAPKDDRDFRYENEALGAVLQHLWSWVNPGNIGSYVVLATAFIQDEARYNAQLVKRVSMLFVRFLDTTRAALSALRLDEPACFSELRSQLGAEPRLSE